MANTPVSGLPAAASAGTNDLVPIVQAGTTKKATVAQIIANVVSGGGSSGTPLGITNVKDFGAKGDNATDDYNSIANAIANVAARNIGGDATGIVYFPPGVYLSGSTITVPKNITFVGEGMEASKLIYSGATNTNGVFTTWGTAGNINTNCGVRNMQINGADKLGWAMLMYGPQEGSIIARAHICGGTIGGLDCRSQGIVGGNNKLVIEGCWIWTSTNTGMYGAKFDDANGPFTIRDTTFQGTGRTANPPAGSAGIYFNGGYQLIHDVNVESFESHTSIDAWSNYQGNLLSAYTCTYGITRRAYAGADAAVRFVVENLTFDSATAYIRDLQTGVTITTCKRYSNREIDASAWNGAHLTMGAFHFWVDASGRLRTKSSAPTSDTDGTVVGTQA